MGCSRWRPRPRSATASCRCGRVRGARYDRLCDRSRTCAAGTIALVARRCCSVAVADRRERDGTKQKLSVAWRRRTDGTRRLTKARMRPPSECPVASSGLVTDETEIEIREPSRADPEWVARHLRAWWGSTTIVGHGGDWDVARLPALLTVRVEQIVGLATFEVQNVELSSRHAQRVRGRYRRGIDPLGRGHRASGSEWLSARMADNDQRQPPRDALLSAA